MDPDVGVTKCCDSECRYRVEANCYGPKQKECVDVHSVVRESENAFLNKGHIAILWIEMVGSGSPYYSEVSLNAVHGINSR